MAGRLATDQLRPVRNQLPCSTATSLSLIFPQGAPVDRVLILEMVGIFSSHVYKIFLCGI